MSALLIVLVALAAWFCLSFLTGLWMFHQSRKGR